MPTGPIIKEGFPLIGAMLIIAVVLGFLGHYVHYDYFIYSGIIFCELL